MATSDQELIEEVRAITGYEDSTTFSDNDIQTVVHIAKEEIRSHLGNTELTFYQTGNNNTHDADRALFWFTCIGLKARAGEIGSVDLTVDSLEQTSSQGQFSFWFEMFGTRIRAATDAGVNGPSGVQISRDEDRTYQPNLPDLGEM